jgi:biopolymer transport protein TolR
MTNVGSAEPNVTPMIDVLLVLLIVFMVASVQMHHTMDAQLPERGCNTAVCEDSRQIVLEVLAGPTYRINAAPVAPGDLLDQLSSIYRDRPEKIIQVAGHPGAHYEDVVSAMDIARSAGIRVISIAPRESYLAAGNR